jgi:hypothetical protein
MERPDTSSTDRDAALTVINTAARWYTEFLPPEDNHLTLASAASVTFFASRLLVTAP